MPGVLVHLTIRITFADGLHLPHRVRRASGHNSGVLRGRKRIVGQQLGRHGRGRRRRRRKSKEHSNYILQACTTSKTFRLYIMSQNAAKVRHVCNETQDISLLGYNVVECIIELLLT